MSHLKTTSSSAGTNSHKSLRADPAAPTSAVATTVDPSRLPAMSFMDPSCVYAPLVPVGLLKRHHCYIAADGRFTAAARLLQSLWRDDAGLALGIHCNPRAAKRKRIKLGSRLAPDAARAGHNFVSRDVLHLVHRTLVMREPGAFLDESRLFANALSSMPLVFNLLGPLALDPAGLGTAVFRALLPDFVHTVTSIGFESSPGRGDPTYLADGTAFDAVIAVTTPDGEDGTIFVEMKYSEGMTGPVADPRPRYDEASRECGLFVDPHRADLRRASLEQLWRLAMLAQLTITRRPHTQGRLVVIAPRLNHLVTDAVARFRAELVDPSGATLHDGGRPRIGFTAISLEDVIARLAAAGAADLAGTLHRRYADFGRVAQVALDAFRHPSGVGVRSQPRSSSSPAGRRSVLRPEPAGATVQREGRMARTTTRRSARVAPAGNNGDAS